jgi:UDP-N-acetylmuramate--alanine ligase
LIAAFQPHLYSRTRNFHREFGDSLAVADGVILAPIYAAREEPIPGIESGLIAERLASHKISLGCRVAERLEDVPEMVVGIAKPGDLLMTIGAGSIYRCGREILSRLKGVEVHP